MKDRSTYKTGFMFHWKNALFIFFCCFLWSCSSGPQELFVIDNEIEFILPGGLNTVETHVFIIRDVPTFFDQSLEAYSIRKEDVAQIGAGRGLLTGSFINIDYDFIGEISIRALSQRDRGLTREMFYRENIPFTHDGELQLLSSISNLTDIFTDPFVDIEIRIRLRNIVPTDLQNKLIFSYAVFDSE
jgi:hypothetical protein